MQPVLNVRSGRLDFVLAHEYERLDVDEGRLHTANLSYARGVYQFTRRAALRAVLQYMDVEFDTELSGRDRQEERRLASQLLFSYKVNPQTVLYLGYSDSHFGDETSDVTPEERTFFAKIGYAWVL